MANKSVFLFDNLIENNQLTCRIVRLEDLNANPWDSIGDSYRSNIGSYENPDQPYQGYEMLRGFLQGETSFDASNSWGTFKSFGSRVTSALTNSIVGKEVTGTDFLNAMRQHGNNILSWINKNFGEEDPSSETVEWLNQRLINYTDYAKMYQGTDVNFPFSFETTLLADEDGKDPRLVIRRCLGDLVGKLKNPDDNENSWFENLTGTYYGELVPPGNFIYSPDAAKGNRAQRGTVCLFIGESIVIRNLLINQLDINVSNQVVYTSSGKGVPLYVKVSITFVPAAYFSAADISRALGDSTGTVLGFRSSEVPPNSPIGDENSIQDPSLGGGSDYINDLNLDNTMEGNEILEAAGVNQGNHTDIKTLLDRIYDDTNSLEERLKALRKDPDNPDLPKADRNYNAMLDIGSNLKGIN